MRASATLLFVMLSAFSRAQGLLHLSSGQAFPVSFSAPETIFINPADLASLQKEIQLVGSFSEAQDHPFQSFASVSLPLSKHTGMGIGYHRSSLDLLQNFVLVKDEGTDKDEKDAKLGVFYEFTRAPILESDQTVLGQKQPVLERDQWSVGFGMEVPSKLDIPLFWGMRVRYVQALLRAQAQPGEFNIPAPVILQRAFSTFSLDTGLTTYLQVKFFKEKWRKRLGFGVLLKNLNEPSIFSPLAIEELYLPTDLFRLKRAWQMGGALEWSPQLKVALSVASEEEQEKLRFGIIKERLKIREQGANYTLAAGFNDNNFSFGIQRTKKHVKISYAFLQHESPVHQEKKLHHFLSFSYLP